MTYLAFVVLTSCSLGAYSLALYLFARYLP
jgi:hypothetical protein